MFNYSNLNDVEFEELCRDILNKKYSMKLRTFARGRDKGIDLADSKRKINTLAQVKHYVNSTVSNLIAALRNEISNVKRINPKEYFICTSLSLSAEKINEIYEMFSDYMNSKENIWAKQDIDSFLHEPENKNIVVKNFKLWIDNSGILQEITNNQIFVDCETLMSNISREKNLFVRTSMYDDAVKLLKENKVLMIMGNPGVGKTMLTKMLALKYAVDGYKVRFTTNVTNLTELKNSLSRNPKDKEIVLIDDCFGQAYFEMKESQSNELMSLIDYVNLANNKVLVLNSRITIYQEAKNRSTVFRQSEEDEKYCLQKIDVNEMNDLDRAKIFYNHIYFYKLPQAYFDEIKKGKRYFSIIKHENYNPRIIEFVCKKYFYDKIEVADYYNKIMENLDNPEQIWENEYENRLQKVDRILLTTIYSFSDTEVPYNWVETAFNARVKKEKDIDITQNQFIRSYKRLLDGFIVNTEFNNGRAVRIINPSINDYLDKRMKNNSLEKSQLIENAISIIQINRLMSDEEYNNFMVESMQNHSISKYLCFLNTDISIVNIIVKYTICDHYYSNNIKNCINNYIPNYKKKLKDYFVENKIDELFTNIDMVKYYGLVNIFELHRDQVKHILMDSTIEVATNSINNLYRCMATIQQSQYLKYFVDIIEYAMINYCAVLDPVQFLDGSIYDIIASHTVETEHGKDIKIDEIEIEAKAIIDDELSDIFYEQLKNLPADIRNMIKYNNMSDYVPHIYNYIRESIDPHYDDDYYEDIDYKSYTKLKNYDETIESMFNKK